MSSLFHSLVVCGAGLTLVSCGGRSEENHQEPESPRGERSGEGGSSSGPSAAGSVSNGGSFVLTPTGGSNTAGSISLGGTAAVVKPGPLLPGSEGQWVCHGEVTGCTSGNFEGTETYGFHIGSACAADPTRPKSSDDCKGQGKLSCSIGFFDGQAVLFNCECRTPAVNDGCPCPERADRCYRSRGSDYCDEQQSYCGCAMTCIAK